MKLNSVEGRNAAIALMVLNLTATSKKQHLKLDELADSLFPFKIKELSFTQKKVLEFCHLQACKIVSSPVLLEQFYSNPELDNPVFNS